ncbi:hypothetical protein BDV96DRAFT_230833 [Lophiotrema nucula]|uniref:Uncharacterized protein n=1 Tax=Lophiotrema nucula TaxID=690887 RepID=A0A6A5YQS3_9PLEO|nr:hypothetical protein BDV96DRAFT_230833 [Lophiotrema nucula]
MASSGLSSFAQDGPTYPPILRRKMLQVQVFRYLLVWDIVFYPVVVTGNWLAVVRVKKRLTTSWMSDLCNDARAPVAEAINNVDGLKKSCRVRRAVHRLRAVTSSGIGQLKHSKLSCDKRLIFPATREDGNRFVSNMEKSFFLIRAMMCVNKRYS